MEDGVAAVVWGGGWRRRALMAAGGDRVRLRLPRRRWYARGLVEHRARRVGRVDEQELDVPLRWQRRLATSMG